MIGRQFEGGQFIRFTYHGFNTQDPFKEVLVLNPSWNGKMQGLDLKRMTPAEVEVLRAVMDPASKGKPHRLPLVNDILRRLDPLELVSNPIAFWQRFIKPFIHGSDVYRQYWPARMYGIQVMKQSEAVSHVQNPKSSWNKPLFKK